MQKINKMTPVNRTLRGVGLQKAIAAICVIAMTFVIGWTVWTLPSFSDRMHDLVVAHLSISGVENPVTAVLLNFRGYDTLLEIAVLLLAAVSVLSTATASSFAPDPPPSSIQTLLLRQLLPFIVLVGGYILWVGKYAPGGAFQAGAILAAGGVLLVISSARKNHLTITTTTIPIGLSIGLTTFLAVALATMIAGENYLQYPPAWAGALILLIEAAATVSIAVILTILFIGEQPARGGSTGDE
ncbi:MAG: sodium:proton antiporter [Deltaproteobacteria bacterium]|jgi:multisubunit Na+/H+ antiporter MnhB subunit|nr:sodium:proton antiporter [Deltaproteobacteria bacterium]